MKLRGVVPPMVTPLVGRDELDIEGLERLVAHLLKGRVHGIFILGTTGEAPSLSYHLRRDLITRVCNQVNGQVFVLVGVSDTAFAESVRLAESAADAGARAVVLTMPYYFPLVQAELIEFFENIVPRMPLPVILYNMPEMTKERLEIETLKRLSSMEPIIGVKDSGGSMDYFSKLLQLKQYRPDWSIMTGPEPLFLESLRLGGDGCVSGGANVFPGLYVDCYESFASGDLPNAERLYRRIIKFQKLYSIGQYSSRVIKAQKCALNILGICDDFLAEPFHRFREPEREQVRKILEAVRKM